MAGLCYQWWSLTSNRSPSSFIYPPQTKAWTVRTRCETCWRCSSKPDPPDLLQSSRRCPAITRPEACSRSTSHYMDPSDPPGHRNTGDWCSRAGRGQIILATNRNGGMLRLIAPRHDDDDDESHALVHSMLQFLLHFTSVKPNLICVWSKTKLKAQELKPNGILLTENSQLTTAKFRLILV